MLDDVSLARALHIVGVVLWIGGVGFVTTVLLPAVRRIKDPTRRVAFFETVESGFAWQARATTLLVGGSGLYLIVVLDLWHRFTQIAYWWMHAMTLIWMLFTFLLFVAEPLFLHRWFTVHAQKRPIETFRLIQRLHWILLAASLVTVLGAMLGSHGAVFF
ncbi:MAG: hypothetical protein ACTSU0_03225 [Alphaproteobacteria bacterium]